MMPTCFCLCAQIPKAQAGNGDNHAVSATKFRMLRSFLRLGYAVMLSDVVRLRPSAAEVAMNKRDPKASCAPSCASATPSCCPMW